MKLGIQLYSVMESLQKDPVATLQKVAEIGYQKFEVANYNVKEDPGIGLGMPAGEAKALLTSIHARVVSAHMFPLLADQMAPILAYHQELGTEFLGIPMDFYTDKEDILRKADNMNKVGALLKDHGIELVYHNHHHEFQRLGEETVYDIILGNTDPDLVKIELDTYWAMRGGNDPAQLLKKLGKRVRLIHQKDYPKGMDATMNLIDALNASGKMADMAAFQQAATPDAFTEIGTGIMDIQSIIDAANEYCDVEYLILEQDHSQHVDLESIAISKKEFARFTGIDQ